MTCWQGKRSQTVQFTKQISESRKLYLARHEIAHVAGIKKEGRKTRSPSLFPSLLPLHLSTPVTRYAWKRRWVCYFWTGRRRKVRSPSVFPLPLIPHPFQCLPYTPRMKHENERGWVTFGSGITAGILQFFLANLNVDSLPQHQASPCSW